MKKYSMYACLSILACACITRKDERKSQQVLQQLQSKAQSSTDTWRYVDSTARYWFYETDSPFLYHPDKGLYGLNGSLRMDESTQTKWLRDLQADTTMIAFREEKAMDTVVSRYRPKIGYIVIATILLLLIYLMYRRRR